MTDVVIQRHFVTFYYPGAIVSGSTTVLIDAWDVEAARAMAESRAKEHGGVLPYGFQFTTQGRGEQDLDSRQIAKSPFYWLGGVVETREQIEARNDPRDRILIGNMRTNDYKRIITNTNSWKFTGALGDDDVVLEMPQR
jgi:hypothetical protein